MCRAGKGSSDNLLAMILNPRFHMRPLAAKFMSGAGTFYYYHFGTTNS